jgi:hypothetical protein
MKTIDTLVNSYENRAIGNHKVIVGLNTRQFIYFATAICVVDDKRRIFYIDNGGYDTQSTRRALNQYRREFSHYQEVSKAEFKQEAVTV